MPPIFNNDATPSDSNASPTPSTPGAAAHRPILPMDTSVEPMPSPTDAHPTSAVSADDHWRQQAPPTSASTVSSIHFAFPDASTTQPNQDPPTTPAYSISSLTNRMAASFVPDAFRHLEQTARHVPTSATNASNNMHVVAASAAQSTSPDIPVYRTKSIGGNTDVATGLNINHAARDAANAANAANGRSAKRQRTPSPAPLQPTPATRRSATPAANTSPRSGSSRRQQQSSPTDGPASRTRSKTRSPAGRSPSREQLTSNSGRIMPSGRRLNAS